MTAGGGGGSKLLSRETELQNTDKLQAGPTPGLEKDFIFKNCLYNANWAFIISFYIYD